MNWSAGRSSISNWPLGRKNNGQNRMGKAICATRHQILKINLLDTIATKSFLRAFFSRVRRSDRLAQPDLRRLLKPELGFRSLAH
jgi:hypothetical protein